MLCGEGEGVRVFLRKKDRTSLYAGRKKMIRKKPAGDLDTMASGGFRYPWERILEFGV